MNHNLKIDDCKENGGNADCPVDMPMMNPYIPKWVEKAKTLKTEHFVHVSNFINMVYDNPE